MCIVVIGVVDVDVGGLGGVTPVFMVVGVGVVCVGDVSVTLDTSHLTFRSVDIGVVGVLGGVASTFVAQTINKSVLPSHEVNVYHLKRRFIFYTS